MTETILDAGTTGYLFDRRGSGGVEGNSNLDQNPSQGFSWWFPQGHLSLPVPSGHSPSPGGKDGTGAGLACLLGDRQAGAPQWSFCNSSLLPALKSWRLGSRVSRPCTTCVIPPALIRGCSFSAQNLLPSSPVTGWMVDPQIPILTS